MNETRRRMLLFLAAAVLIMGGCNDMTDVGDDPDPPNRPATRAPVVLANLEVTPGPISPTVSAELRNTWTKTVQAVSWWASFVDGHNRPVLGFGDDPASNFIFQRRTIAPGETVSAEWFASFFNLAVRVDDHAVCEVTFTDGSQWEPDTFDSNC